MKIELICTGSELLSGKVNTNAVYIGAKISEIGLELSSIISVGDKKNDLLDNFKSAFKRSDVIIVTGGLGPTFDDITVEVIANCLNLEIYSDEKVINAIKEYFSKRKITYIPKISEKQANIIREAKILENCSGTAPGQMLQFEFENNKKTLFLLPGPPVEMESMFKKNVEPFLKNSIKNVRKTTVLHVFGISESSVDEIVRPIRNEAIFNNPKLSIDFSILANESVIDIKFSVSGTNELVVNEIMNTLKLKFNNTLKEHIFGTNRDTFASVIGRLLTKSEKTIALAESCTGGMIAATITEVPGSSLYFKTSVVTYSDESKIKLLNVNKSTLINFGAVSKEIAEEMAKGILKLSGSDFAFSITGITGPGGSTKDKSVGLVYVGFADKNTSKNFRFKFRGTRKEIRIQIINTVFDLLKKEYNSVEMKV
ncbi:MAG: competence/damage-inducible protein A [Endomicrobium sp.]|jgi:nicotinamide-nucleotide amidase|nr:competence/damage-inducible protein A [Endomicrobium sp.]